MPVPKTLKTYDNNLNLNIKGMKKTLMGLAVLAMSLLPAAANAQTENNSTSGINIENTKGKASKKDKKDKKDRKDAKSKSGDKKGKDGRGKKGDGKCVKQGCQNQKAECKAGKKGNRDMARKGDFKDQKKGRDFKGTRGGKAYNDSINFASLNLNDTQMAQIQALNEARRASVREKREQIRAAKAAGDTTFVMNDTEMVELQSKYLKDLHEILTADQYVQFLENNYVNAQPRMMKDKKQMRPGRRMERPAKGMTNAAKLDNNMTISSK